MRCFQLLVCMVIASIAFVCGAAVLIRTLNKSVIRVAVRAGGSTFPERSEHSIKVNDGAGGTSIRHFIVYEHRNPKWVVLILHPTYKSRFNTTAADDLTPVLRYEEYMSEQGQAKVWADHGALLVWLVGRRVDGQYCWGTGTDNKLSSAPYKGKEDESFVLAVLNWLKGRSMSVYLYGFSGGGRMAWRITCNSTLAMKLTAVFVSSGLLSAEVRDEPLCNVSTMPPTLVTHGVSDEVTNIRYADESVAWISAAAKCNTSILTGVGKGWPVELLLHNGCSNARSDFRLAYYRMQGEKHYAKRSAELVLSSLLLELSREKG
jgi:dienelactone hydrolase